MRFAIIEHGQVANVAEAEEALAPNWVKTDTAGPGWLYDEATGALSAPLPAAPAIPQAVSMRQAKRALLAAGLLDAADLAIVSIPDDTARRAAQIDWTTSTEVRRDWPLVAAIAQALSLTDEQIDALFVSASQL
ncbi:hypothetical protein PSQ39_21460 [Curvibacter sp. HBC28]|uniref:XRE family transcriptional regulator n=1 Tax=Curvibacter microcysteis TaxID=3026419 RepID=A0ABT5MMY5_9BURK|nr:hypothetical protein [Curvibacter sp. HBC28]MDD0817217.1 hypothetical protein [Curvibacter sp. HBC28]